jgi:hypothetical protein
LLNRARQKLDRPGCITGGQPSAPGGVGIALVRRLVGPHVPQSRDRGSGLCRGRADHRADPQDAESALHDSTAAQQRQPHSGLVLFDSTDVECARSKGAFAL